MNDLTPARLRDLTADATLRPRDLADQLGIPEAALVEAHLGCGAVRIDATVGLLIPAVTALGEVMALTRNASCVIEKVGIYNDFQDGDHAAMTLDPDIDLRMFPRHWVHAYAVDLNGRKSVQVFDAAGDAVHKVHLRASSDLGAWAALASKLAVADQQSLSAFGPRAHVDPAPGSEDKVDTLRREWAAMTDTHQFNTLIRRLKMNRLGTYRLVGQPYARRLAIAASDALFTAVHEQGRLVMLFVGNNGCIEIHSGGIGSLMSMDPWLNVLDDRFNLHLRADHVDEVWAIRKPTKRGDALSVEAFDRYGALIYQCFGLRPEKGGDVEAWEILVGGLPE